MHQQLGCLRADDPEVLLDRQVRVVHVHQLQDFAFGDHVRGLGQCLEHAYVADRDHHLEGPRIQ
jgi:hypothetical protein